MDCLVNLNFIFIIITLTIKIVNNIQLYESWLQCKYLYNECI